jgi:VCBS repeat-containing protein
MASRLTVFLEEAFGKSSVGKSRLAWTVCALVGLTLAGELGLAQSNTSHPPVISTSTSWTLDAPTLASSSGSGVPSNGFSIQGGFSPDGTHLLFWSRSTNISPAATSGFSELYLKDLTTGQVSVVSADANGVEGNSDSVNPNNSSQILMFSPDGTKVVFESAATNLAAGANGHQQVFIKDLTTGLVTLVSADANGIQGNGTSTDFTFSPDGTKVAFDSASTNLIPAGSAGEQVFVKDLTTGAVTLVSSDATGVAGNGASSFPVFSPDGTQLAFASTSTNLAAGATNTHSQIFVKNLQSGAITVASTDASGNEANNDSLYPMFSPDGSKLAFNSISTNLVPNVPSFNSEVYAKDLASGAITLVSTDANGVPANGNSTQLGAFSPDSTKIAFQSASTNLMSGANGASQVFVKDLLSGTITVASANAAGVLANGNSVMPTFSPNHLALAFQSGSTNLGVNSFTSQIYVRSIFTASGATADNSFATSLSTAGQLAFSDADTADTHTASVAAQAGDLGTVTASVSKDSAGSGTGGVVLWNYQVSESQLHMLTAPATDNFTLTLTDSQGCTATTAIVVTALPQDFAITNATTGSAPTSVSTSTSSCPTLAVTSSPSSVTVTSGQNASFSASATGTPAPTVQWQVSTDGGTTFTNVPGATSTTLTFAADMSHNGNLYRAVFTNASGSVTSSAASLTVNAAGATTSVTSSKNPTVFGQAVTFTATVSATSGTPTGTVTFLDGASSLGTLTLDSTGAASFTTSALAVGNHAITASYSGDSNFNANSSSPFTQIVQLDVAAVAVNASPNPSVFGQPVVVAATVSATAPGSGTPTGTVTFLDGLTSLGAANLVNGQASFTITSLATGLHSLMATYAGDGSFSQNSGVAGQTVNRASTNTSLSSSANPSINQSVTFTATVSAVAPGAGAPTGSVAFSDGTTSLGMATLDSAGTASFTTSSLASGAHAITASYAGDSNFNASTSTLTEIVNKNGATVTLSSSANPSVFGQSVSFTITIAAASGSGTPTGTVVLQDGAASMSTFNLVNGQASFTTSGLAVGSHSITAAYRGDLNFNAASTTLLQTVTKDASSVSLNSSANPSVFGQSQVITATVSPIAPGAGTPTGTVTFSDGTTSLGSVNLANGQASFTLAGLGVGSHSINASYAGDGRFNSSSSTLVQTVNKASTTTTLSSSATPSTVSQSATFTASVNAVAPGAGTPTGSVTFNDGANALATVSLGSNGTATFSTSSLAVMSHSITAVYNGDSNFNGSTGSLTENVQYAICAQYDQTRSVQGGATFPIKLQICDANGTNLSSQSIVLHATAILAASGVAGPVQDSGNANPDDDFRPTGGSGQNAAYIFNLSTNGLPSGTYTLQFAVQGDPVLHTVLFGVN